MNDRERFIACVLGQPLDRPPFWLYWSPWGPTWRRWIAEGKPATVRDHRTVFGVDQPPRSLPVNCGPCPKIELRTISDDGQVWVHVESWGIVRRDFRDHESMSEFIEFPVKDRADWIRFRDAYLNPDDPARLDGDWRALAEEWQTRGTPIQLGYYPDVGIFGTVRWLLGDEECLIAFRSQPDLVHEIMDHMTSLYLAVFSKVVAEVQVDVIHLWEDMCAQHGPLIGPRMWEQFMGPCYRRIAAFARQHNISVISVDTDGNPDLITGPMMRAGVNFLFPMEVAGGCDVNVWRARYPTLAMMGGIDKRALARGPEAIDRELARIAPVIATGRYIPDLDHLVPDDVSWENYQYYAHALKRLVGAEDA